MRLTKPIVLLSLIAACIPPGLAQRAGQKKAPVKPTVKTAVIAAAPTPVPLKVEFLRDIAPILDKTGCSTAQCHGKFGGRGGFQLSLLTLAPEDDYEPIVYGGRGRRINFAEPGKSLLLRKSTGQFAHAGGPRFSATSREYLYRIDTGPVPDPFDARYVWHRPGELGVESMRTGVAVKRSSCSNRRAPT